MNCPYNPMSHIVIDGYNLIRQSDTLSQIDAKNLEKGRMALLRRLETYRQHHGHSTTVVFDASNSFNREIEKERVGGIEVLYSEQGKSADDMIIRIARHFGSRVMVVTSDKEILRAAKASGCGCLTADEFFKKMDAALMAGAMIGEEKKEEPPLHKRWITKKKGPAKRLPKDKRRALSKL